MESKGSQQHARQFRKGFIHRVGEKYLRERNSVGVCGALEQLALILFSSTPSISYIHLGEPCESSTRSSGIYELVSVASPSNCSRRFVWFSAGCEKVLEGTGQVHAHQKPESNFITEVARSPTEPDGGAAWYWYDHQMPSKRDGYHSQSFVVIGHAPIRSGQRGQRLGVVEGGERRVGRRIYCRGRLID